MIYGLEGMLNDGEVDIEYLYRQYSLECNEAPSKYI